jgi:hypothetical protein
MPAPAPAPRGGAALPGALPHPFYSPPWWQLSFPVRDRAPVAASSSPHGPPPGCSPAAGLSCSIPGAQGAPGAPPRMRAASALTSPLVAPAAAGTPADARGGAPPLGPGAGEAEGEAADREAAHNGRVAADEPDARYAPRRSLVPRAPALRNPGVVAATHNGSNGRGSGLSAEDLREARPDFPSLPL